jgi:serine dehydrogenase proteinase
MSAGTVWALSGDEIWMDERATLGPIDPQVPGRDGRFLPAQALLALIEEIQIRGDQQIKNGANPRWTDVTILRNMDAKVLRFNSPRVFWKITSFERGLSTKMGGPSQQRNAGGAPCCALAPVPCPQPFTLPSPITLDVSRCSFSDLDTGVNTCGRSR